MRITTNEHSPTATMSEPSSGPELEHLDWPDPEPEDCRSPTERLRDQLVVLAAVKALRAVLQFNAPSSAYSHYQARDDDPIEVLLIKLAQARDDPFVTSVDRKRLKRFSLAPYFLRQPVPPYRKRGPRATLNPDEWRSIGNAQKELLAIFKNPTVQVPATTVEMTLKEHLPEWAEIWSLRARNSGFVDHRAHKPHRRTRYALMHFLGLKSSAIAHGIARARQNRRYAR